MDGHVNATPRRVKGREGGVRPSGDIELIQPALGVSRLVSGVPQPWGYLIQRRARPRRARPRRAVRWRGATRARGPARVFPFGPPRRVSHSRATRGGAAAGRQRRCAMASKKRKRRDSAGRTSTGPRDPPLTVLTREVLMLLQHRASRAAAGRGAAAADAGRRQAADAEANLEAAEVPGNGSRRGARRFGATQPRAAPRARSRRSPGAGAAVSSAVLTAMKIVSQAEVDPADPASIWGFCFSGASPSPRCGAPPALTRAAAPSAHGRRASGRAHRRGGPVV